MHQELAAGTRVYSFCGDGRSIGFDMDSTPWAPDEAAFRGRGPGVTAGEAAGFLEAHHYPYFTFNGTCSGAWANVIQALSAMPRVRTVFTEPGFVLAELQPPNLTTASLP
jgi:hypothetical protein